MYDVISRSVQSSSKFYVLFQVRFQDIGQLLRRHCKGVHQSFGDYVCSDGAFRAGRQQRRGLGEVPAFCDIPGQGFLATNICTLDSDSFSRVYCKL